MAKQSGLHQIRGKIGEHSYYRQSGVASGLIRGINQGLSSRVKTGDEYANTRLNNAEFGQACRIASVVAQYIVPKFRPMVLPFSQSKMAKIILEYIKVDSTAPWGQRNIVVANSGDMQVSALNSVAKNRFEDFGLELTIDEEQTQLSVAVTAQTLNKLSAIGATGISFRFVASTTWIGTFVQSTGKYADSYPRANIYDGQLGAPSEGDEFVFTYALRPSPPSGWPAIAATRTGLLIVMPYRTINDMDYILQEDCTFKAFIIENGVVN